MPTINVISNLPPPNAMTKYEWRIPVGADETSAVYESATDGDDIALVVCAHGAGGNIADRSTVASANALRKQGFGVVRFNFLYKEKGSGRPDAMPKLTNTFSAVIAHARAALGDPRPLIIGGRSMGGRAASVLVSEGFDADGLLLLAYPLHPPGQPEKLRDAHLPSITMPVLAFSGTRDPFVTREIMTRVLSTVTAPWDMQWVEGADHSFHVLKSSGTTDAAVMARIGERSKAWAQKLRG
jgi:predicted alpha/beta-hydrolase family hydrolase